MAKDHGADSAVGASKTACLLTQDSGTSEVENGNITAGLVGEAHGVGDSVDDDGVGFIAALFITNFIFRLEFTTRADTHLSVDDTTLRIVTHLTEGCLVDGIEGINASTT